MFLKNPLLNHLFLPFLLLVTANLSAQLSPGVYMATKTVDKQTETHRLVISPDYMVHSVYQENPANFVLTYGGYYEHGDGIINLALEFNSNYELDGIRDMEINYSPAGDKFQYGDTGLVFSKTPELKQDLDGFWLFATRGPDTGQERRGDDNARKTLKVLVDGTFQWIAYHTETFKFSGTGGGSYTAKDGTYTEAIVFFSRDNSRAGAELQFEYERMGNDWHHKGKNSRGEPMYEIWSLRWAD